MFSSENLFIIKYYFSNVFFWKINCVNNIPGYNKTPISSIVRLQGWVSVFPS